MRRIRWVTHQEYEYLDAPTPIKKLIPEWYRLGEMTTEDGSPGLKSCGPFLDPMLMGYAVCAWDDITVGKTETGEMTIRWGDGLAQNANIILERTNGSGKTIPRPTGFASNHLVWQSKYGWKTPRGYSTLVTHPLNRNELPFFTTSGVIDSDKFIAWGNIPFFIKEGWTGVIPKGTPIFQVIPFKRDAWIGIKDNEGLRKEASRIAKFVRADNGQYKKHLWQKKRFD